MEIHHGERAHGRFQFHKLRQTKAERRPGAQRRLRHHPRHPTVVDHGVIPTEIRVDLPRRSLRTDRGVAPVAEIHKDQLRPPQTDPGIKFPAVHGKEVAPIAPAEQATEQILRARKVADQLMKQAAPLIAIVCREHQNRSTTQRMHSEDLEIKTKSHWK